VKGPADDFFNALRAELGVLPIIAEDLGIITPEVHLLRERLGLPGMKVLQFGFGNSGAHIYLPHTYHSNCVVYTGTHDNDTTVGWWESGASADEKRHVLAYAGDAHDGMNWALIRLASASVARLAMVPLQDILGLGSEARMNVPSRKDGNWGWRMSPQALTASLADKLAHLAKVCDRRPHPAAKHSGELDIPAA
jgi:4-alpha-glucanotransferase